MEATPTHPGKGPAPELDLPPRRGLLEGAPRQVNHSTAKLLKRFQHWTIVSLQELIRDMDTIVSINADQVRIKCGMVSFLQRDAICHYRLSKLFVLIFDDVRGIEQQRLPEPGYGATSVVGCDDRSTKERLMKSLLDRS
jgi:hypothetical protein